MCCARLRPAPSPLSLQRSGLLDLGSIPQWDSSDCYLVLYAKKPGVNVWQVNKKQIKLQVPRAAVKSEPGCGLRAHRKSRKPWLTLGEAGSLELSAET